MGSPTVNNGIMYSIAGLLELMKGLKFKNKKAASFGCFGWHDVSTKTIEGVLQDSGFQIISEPVSCLWEPDDKILNRSFLFGKQFVEKLDIK